MEGGDQTLGALQDLLIQVVKVPDVEVWLSLDIRSVALTGLSLNGERTEKGFLLPWIFCGWNPSH